jgi:metal-responsive CopG/Arc/MetJ family transcriptional regulator
MKTAVSIPDDLFAQADKLARQAKTSRSDIYARALAEYLDRHMPENVTEQMNRALAEVEADDDSFIAESSRRTLKRSPW